MSNKGTTAGISLLVLWALLPGCPVETPEEAAGLDSLVGTFWIRVAGTEAAILYFLSETQVMTGDTFKAYTYQGNNTGAVTGLGDFTLSPDGETLILSEGAPFTRQPDRIPDDTLMSTRWIFGNTLSLEFTSPVEAVMGQHTYLYTYEDTDKTGLVEELGGFTYDKDTQTLTFTRYKGGSPLSFKTQLDPVLVGTVWRWGHGFIEFTAPNKVKVGSGTYTYVYDDQEKAGTIKNVGPFTIAEGPGEGLRILSFAEYKSYGRPVVFTEQLEEHPITLEDTLIGTEWFWSSTWGDSFLVFMTETSSINGEYMDWYTYDPATRKGEIEYMGPFILSSDGMTLNFTNYGGYGHGATFIRRD